MATLKALRAAKQKLMAPPGRMPERARRAACKLNQLIDAASIAKDKDIAERGALAVTTPWRVGEWQEGERYEYEPRIPIYDDAGEEIFEITADDKPDDPMSVAAIALANDIVTAVNMHRKLVAFVQDNLPNCMPRASKPDTCDGCDRECEEGLLLKEAQGDK